MKGGQRGKFIEAPFDSGVKEKLGMDRKENALISTHNSFICSDEEIPVVRFVLTTQDELQLNAICQGLDEATCNRMRAVLSSNVAGNYDSCNKS